jgi:hypothetical protein
MISHKLDDALANRIFATHVVFTDPSPKGARPMHQDDFNRRFHDFSRRLNRRNLLWRDYIATWGVHPSSGRLHKHVLAVAHPFLHASVLREVGIKSGLWRDGSRKHAIRLKAITSPEHAYNFANYLGRNALAYAAHERSFSERIQPVSRSRNRP